MILFRENPKDSTIKLLKLGNKLVKLQDTKPIQKSVVFLYTNNKLSEKENKKPTPFITASKGIKYLGINLTKEVKDLYTENYTTLKKETDKILIFEKIFHAHG